VAKDERVVALLEVAESFRERYLEVAAQTSFAYIISALNILNDAGVNYKSARNKRLHAELCLIRLSYLQQAMDIAASGEGLVKKKVIDAVKPVAFRRIPLITVPKSREQPAVKTVVPEEKPRATLLVETPLPKKTIPAPSTRLPENQPGTGRLGGLANIRKQFAKNSGTADAAAPVALTDALLREAWVSFTVQLKESKNPAGQSFDLAELRIKDEKSFDIVTPNNLQLKFIESERVRLSEYLQDKFNNRSLTFYILIDENAEPPEKVELPLNTREQYQQLVEKYPLVKELKDRLRLDLEY
jgi:DNA polymerase-3 subunit gamma/tau